MSLMELFINYSKGNNGNTEVTAPVTATDQATYIGISGNSENTIFGKKSENNQLSTIKVYCYRMTDKPTTELTVIMPNTELEEAIEKMKNKFGDRLLDIYPSPYCIAGTLANNTKH